MYDAGGITSGELTFMRRVAPFVGRRQHLQWFERSLQTVSTGRPQVILIQGEAGLGKTRLLTEMRTMAMHRGVRVYASRCYEDLALPYLPFIEALRTHLEQLPKDAEHMLTTESEALRLLLYRDRLASVSSRALHVDHDDQDKLRLLLALAKVMIALTRQCQTLLVLDDLHWADPSSLDLLSHLVFSVAEEASRQSVPLLIVGSYRPVERSDRLARIMARFRREEICQMHELHGLQEVEVYDLLCGLGVGRPSHQLVTTITEVTQGSPLFIEEVLHYLVKQNLLQEGRGYVVTTSSAAHLRLPEHITGMILARTTGLSEACHQVLTLASCLGERFPLWALRAVSQLSEEALLNLLEEGMRHALLFSNGEDFQFIHPLMRHVFYNTPSTARRQRVHQQIAQMLEDTYADSLETHLLDIAHHIVRAGSAADAAKVVHYARRAGDQARALFAWREAAHYYTAALSAAKGSRAGDVQDQADLHYLAGLSYLWDGDIGPCQVHFEAAVMGYQQTDNQPGLARVLMEKTFAASTSMSFGTQADLHALEQVLEALGEEEPALRSKILTSMSEAYWAARQPDKAEEMARQALDIGEHLADDHLCAMASFELALARAQNLYIPEALTHYRSSRTYAKRANDRWIEGWPLQRIPTALILLGQFDEAEAAAAEAHEFAAMTNNWGHYSLTLSALTCIAVARGQFEVVDKYGAETMKTLPRWSYPYGAALTLPTVSCARALQGKWVDAEAALDLLVEPGRVFDKPGAPHRAICEVYRRLVRGYAAVYEERKKDLLSDIASMRVPEHLDLTSLASFCALVEIDDLWGIPSRAEHLYQVLSLTASRGIVFSRGWVFLLPRILGIAAAINQWWDKAEGHFLVALDVATKVGALPELGRTYLAYARMLTSRASRDDHAYALELLRQAQVIFDELHMHPFTRYTTELTETLQNRLLSSRPPHATSPTQRSEPEVAILLRIAQHATPFLR